MLIKCPDCGCVSIDAEICPNCGALMTKISKETVKKVEVPPDSEQESAAPKKTKGRLLGKILLKFINKK
jgi:hypothetical protein